MDHFPPLPLLWLIHQPSGVYSHKPFIYHHYTIVNHVTPWLTALKHQYQPFLTIKSPSSTIINHTTIHSKPLNLLIKSPLFNTTITIKPSIHYQGTARSALKLPSADPAAAKPGRRPRSTTGVTWRQWEITQHGNMGTSSHENSDNHHQSMIKNDANHGNFDKSW